MEISLAAEKLFDLGPISVTNSLLSAFIIVALVTILAILIRLSLNYSNPSKVQAFMEMMVGGLRGVSRDILGEERTRIFYSFILTFFVFIVLSNWFGLLPIVGPIVKEHPHDETASDSLIEETHQKDDITPVGCIKERDCILTSGGIKRTEAFPVFRAPTSDVSGTLALSLLAVIFVHATALSTLGLGYFKKFFNFSNPINAFVGILELLSEIGKLISFTFRLFGNIFAGEVLLLVITSITLGLATLPFLVLEIFVGFIQAFVFFMLVLVFLSLAVQRHEH